MTEPTQGKKGSEGRPTWEDERYKYEVWRLWLHCYASAHSVETYHAPPVGSRFRSPFDWAVTKPYLT